MNDHMFGTGIVFIVWIINSQLYTTKVKGDLYMKKVLVTFIIVLSFVLSGCGETTMNDGETIGKVDNSKDSSQSESSGEKDTNDLEKVEIDFISNADEVTLNMYKEIATDFMTLNPHTTVNVSSQGKDYESLMKSNMAVNQLPDVFATHGWSVARYSEYMRPLNDQPWAEDIIDSMIPIISNEKGEIFVLPIDADQAGIIINKKVLSSAGIDGYAINSWDEFITACEMVKKNGQVPIGMWGKDPRTFAYFLDVMANPFYVTSPTNNYSQQLQDGTFDWTLWNKISETLAGLEEKGYLNVDVLTADSETVIQEMAKDNIAFIFGGNNTIKGIIEYNESAELGFIPYPAIYEDDSRQFVGGEREAIGVWKDGEHVEQALAFVNYVAQPENIKKICEARGNAPGTKEIDVDLGYLTPDFKRYSNESTPIYSYFDRVMLPSGMWSVLQDVGEGIVAGAYTPEEASKVMEENYLRLRQQ